MPAADQSANQHAVAPQKLTVAAFATCRVCGCCGKQVRRKADSAKGLVREWLANWRDNPLVAASDSHRQLTGAALFDWTSHQAG